MNGRVLSLLLGMSFLGGWSECPLARQLEAPGAPLGFHATATSPTTIDLAWDRDYSVYDYHVSRDPSGMVGSWMLGGSETSYSDAYLTPGTTYTYQIFGENNAGTGPGATASATTFFPDAGAVSDGGAPPPAPTGFTATATSSSTIHLSWNTPLVDATGLILERQDAGAFDEIAQPPVTEAFYDLLLPATGDELRRCEPRSRCQRDDTALHLGIRRPHLDDLRCGSAGGRRTGLRGIRSRVCSGRRPGQDRPVLRGNAPDRRSSCRDLVA